MAEKPKTAVEQRRERISTIAKWQKIFGTPEGKEILNELFKEFWMGRSTATEDPHMTYFYEGQRSVVIWILQSKLKVNVKKLYEQLFMEDDDV